MPSSRRVGVANCPAVWSHLDSSEPITKGRKVSVQCVVAGNRLTRLCIAVSLSMFRLSSGQSFIQKDAVTIRYLHCWYDRPGGGRPELVDRCRSSATVRICSTQFGALRGTNRIKMAAHERVNRVPGGSQTSRHCCTI